MANPPNGAELLVESLIAADVGELFGLPGDTGVALYDALACRAGEIRHVLCRDERHAAVMADVYARCSNRVGVVEVSSGGGASFVVGGLAEAYAASTPILVISSDIHASSRGTGALTELDQGALYQAVTKWVGHVEHASDVPAMVRRALRLATTGRPAPVALVVPENVLDERADVGVPADMTCHVPAHRTAPAPDAVRAVADAMMAAGRPAIVAGGGIHTSHAYEALAYLAERAFVPVATTIHGKGAYPDNAPWALGVAGANGARENANAYLADADFVLFVGTRANATDTNSYRCPPRSCATAQIDIDGERAGRNYPGSIALVGDARESLAALAAAVGDDAPGRDRLRAEVRQARDGAATASPGAGHAAVHPTAVLDVLWRELGSDTLVVADCGTPTPFLAATWVTERAARSIVVARGHGPMGYAIPGAIGAAIANPGRRVVSLTTDGSLGMAAGELETAARMSLPILFIELANGSYGWIKMLQHLYHDGHYFSVDLGAVDGPMVARGFGVQGAHARDVDELTDEVRRFAAQGEPHFVEVGVPDQIAAPPPVAPWTAALSGADRSRPVY